MTDLTPPLPTGQESVPFWRDIRVLGVLAQLIFLIAVILGFSWLAGNVSDNLSSLGESQFLCQDGSTNIRCAFDFLRLDAQFDIAETAIDYDPSDAYARALLVGALNTAKVGFLGIILATILGTITGIARLSPNWLVSSVARWYVDIIRNTPLLLQLFFLFFGVILLFPSIREAIQPFGLPVYLSQRGINLPGPVFMPSFWTWAMFLGAGVVLAVLAWYLLGRREARTGKLTYRFWWSLAVFAAVALGGWFIASALAADNQGFLTSEATGYESFDDLVAESQARLGLDNLRDLDDAVASGAISEEQLAAGTLVLCAVRDDPSEVNLTARLRRANVPYAVERSNRIDQVMDDYAGGACELVVAQRAVLEPEMQALGDPSQLIAPLSEVPVRIDIPRIEGLNFVGGIKMSPNFAAILLGLVIYTGAFIAEIVRAGIQSVPKGQTEAARALGLSEGQRLRLIVLPQALRVIIPPLTSQYLNLVKNSSLAIAVGYPDLWSTAFTTLNQSGRVIQVFVIVMGTYLSFSLLISAFLNWYNRRIALVER